MEKIRNVINNITNKNIIFDICVYHNPCSDGISSAWVVKQKYPDILFVGQYPGCKDFDSKMCENKNVIFVDICPNENISENFIRNKILINLKIE